MTTFGKLKMAFGFAVAALVSTTAHATVFDFGFTGPGAIVYAEVNATRQGQSNLYVIDSYLPGSVISSRVTSPSASTITSTSLFGSTGNTIQYISDTNYSIGSGLAFKTASGADFAISPLGGSFYNLSSTVSGAGTVGMFTLYAGTPAVLGTPGPVAGAGLLPLLGLAGLWIGRRRKSLSAV